MARLRWVQRKNPDYDRNDPSSKEYILIEITDYAAPENKSAAIHFDDTCQLNPMGGGVVRSKKELARIAKENGLVDVTGEKEFMSRRAAEIQKKKEEKFVEDCTRDVSRMAMGLMSEKERAIVKYMRDNNGRTPDWD